MTTTTSAINRIYVQFDESEGGGYVILTQSTSNCKLTIWDNVNGLFGYGATELRLEKIKKALALSRVVVLINTVSDDIANFFKKNFELYGYAEIPVGYNMADRSINQYHFFIRNTFSSSKTYLRETTFSLNKEATTTEKDEKVDQNKLRQVLHTTLKKRRRKTDIVEEIVQQFK